MSVDEIYFDYDVEDWEIVSHNEYEYDWIDSDFDDANNFYDEYE
jgi:hypothetical protein